MTTPVSHSPVWLRILVPCAFVCLVAALTLPLWLRDTHPATWQSLLASIEQDTDIRQPLELALSTLRLEARARNLDDPRTRRRIADHHFLLAEALMSREQPQWMDAALNAYHHAASLKPDLRHGWLLYRWGQALELAGESDDAMATYDRVLTADSGALALQAGYHALKLRATRRDSPLPAAPLSNYIRFFLREGHREALAPFHDTQWVPSLDATFVQGLLQGLTDPERMRHTMNEVLRLDPDHPHALVLAQEPGSALQHIIPRVDLLQGYYAPRALHQTHLRMPHDTQLRSSVHVPEGIHALDIEWRFENPEHRSLLFYVTAAGERQSVVIPSTDMQATTRVRVSPGWNPIELHVFFTDVEADTPPPTVDLQQFIIRRAIRGTE